MSVLFNSARNGAHKRAEEPYLRPFVAKGREICSVHVSISVNSQVIENQEIGFIKGRSMVRRVVGPSSDSNWECHARDHY